MKLFLVGLPGSGKTTLAKEVATRLARKFVDLDHEIVKGESMPIIRIFEKLGEEKFRIFENSYLKKWISNAEDFVMATGGGTPCFHNNMSLINEAGLSVFLDADPDVIADRMLNTELAKRPLFAGQDKNSIVSRIKNMRDERISFYNMAQITFSGEMITAKNIADKVLALEG